VTEKLQLDEPAEGVARLTISNPERRGALDHEILDALAEFARTLDARCLVIRGSGDVFSAGYDIGNLSEQEFEESAEKLVAHPFHDALEALEAYRYPVVAEINGHAIGGGLELALACDIRVASERARFGSFEARRGYHHGDGGIVRLVNTCGAGVALEMLLTAEPIDAERAQRCNLVSRVVPHDELLGAAEQVARSILRNSQVAVRSAKETILDVIGRPLDDQLRIEALNGYACADPEETMELLQRFYDRTDEGRA
jgi:enoyl-CoA hydratase/carnithine racemase